MEKPVLHTTSPIHCKTRQILSDLFSTNQVNGSEMTFLAEANKLQIKNLKT